MGLDFAAIRDTFFDSGKVLAAMEKKERRALSKFGAFVRTRARSSIRKRRKPSSPGSPPSSHVGTLKKLLFFSYDSKNKSVVVGPVPLESSRLAVVPRLLEEGGPVVFMRSIPGLGRKATAPQAAAFQRKVKDGSITVTKREKQRVAGGLEARPFMAPALAAELPKFAAMFKE